LLTLLALRGKNRGLNLAFLGIPDQFGGQKPNTSRIFEQGNLPRATAKAISCGRQALFAGYLVLLGVHRCPFY